MKLINQKIVSFDDMERTGTVEVHPVNPRKLNNLSFTCFKDSRTGIIYGIPLSENHVTGDITWKRITITGIRFYHLENEVDAMEWHVLKHHESVDGSPLQKGKPLLRVYNREAEAIRKIALIKESKGALDIALELMGTKLTDFARVLGISPEQNSPAVVYQMVAEKAQSDPKLFMMHWTNQNRGVHEVFARGKAANLITFTLGSGYMYRNTIPLGLTESAAMNHLFTERTLLSNIDIESKHITKEIEAKKFKAIPKAPTVSTRPTSQPLSVPERRPVQIPKEVQDILDQENDEEEEVLPIRMSEEVVEQIPLSQALTNMAQMAEDANTEWGNKVIVGDGFIPLIQGNEEAQTSVKEPKKPKESKTGVKKNVVKPLKK